MALIEGVGDEVTLFVGLLVALVVLTLAWFSTGVHDRPFISIIVLDRRTFQRFLRRLRGRGLQVFSGSLGNATPTTTTATTPSDESSSSSTPPPVDNPTSTESTPPSANEASETEGSTPTSEGSQLFSIGESAVIEGECDIGRVGEADVVLDRQSLESAGWQPVEVRRRRLEFFGQAGDEDSDNDTHPESSGGVPDLGTRGGSESSATGGPGPSANQSQIEDTSSKETGPMPGSGSKPEPSSSKDSEPEPVAGPSSGPQHESTPPQEGGEEGSIRIRLKYLDDRQRWVQAMPQDTIAHFKRTHFSSEMTNNTVVRIIYNGQELARENASLASYNVGDESVMHCLMSQPRPQPQHNQLNNQPFDIGQLMFPLFALILALLWYSRFTYKQFFNSMSTLTLVGVTLLFMVSLLATWRNNEPAEAEAN